MAKILTVMGIILFSAHWEPAITFCFLLHSFPELASLMSTTEQTVIIYSWLFLFVRPHPHPHPVTHHHLDDITNVKYCFRLSSDNFSISTSARLIYSGREGMLQTLSVKEFQLVGSGKRVFSATTLALWNLKCEESPQSSGLLQGGQNLVI